MTYFQQFLKLPLSCHIGEGNKTILGKWQWFEIPPCIIARPMPHYRSSKTGVFYNCVFSCNKMKCLLQTICLLLNISKNKGLSDEFILEKLEQHSERIRHLEEFCFTDLTQCCISGYFVAIYLWNECKWAKKHVNK